MEKLTFVEAAPANDGGHAVDVGVVARGDAHGQYVALVFDWFGEPEQGQIVLERLRIEQRVRLDHLDAALNERIRFLLVADVELAESLDDRLVSLSY